MYAFVKFCHLCLKTEQALQDFQLPKEQDIYSILMLLKPEFNSLEKEIKLWTCADCKDKLHQVYNLQEQFIRSYECLKQYLFKLTATSNKNGNTDSVQKLTNSQQIVSSVPRSLFIDLRQNIQNNKDQLLAEEKLKNEKHFSKTHEVDSGKEKDNKALEADIDNEDNVAILFNDQFGQAETVTEECVIVLDEELKRCDFETNSQVDDNQNDLERVFNDQFRHADTVVEVVEEVNTHEPEINTQIPTTDNLPNDLKEREKDDSEYKSSHDTLPLQISDKSLDALNPNNHRPKKRKQILKRIDSFSPESPEFTDNFGHHSSSDDDSVYSDTPHEYKFRKRNRSINYHEPEDSNTFTCTVCSSDFPNSRLLLEHMDVHESQRDYKCPYCGSNFICEKHLRAHLQNFHEAMS